MSSRSLPPRLAAVLDLLGPCTVLADVGTDHGLVPVAAVQRGLCVRALATDVREAPLLAARMTVEAAELEDLVRLRRGDGLRALDGEAADGVVMAGMSGTLMVRLLGDAARLGRGIQQVILQPNKDQDLVRTWALHNAWHLRDERMVHEHDRWYVALAFTPGQGADPAYAGLPLSTEALTQVGPHLVRRADPLMRAWCLAQVARLEQFVTHAAHPLAAQLQQFRDVLALVSESSGRPG